jgi:hypothetical protein
MSPVDEVVEAVEDFRAAYDMYDDDSNCRILELTDRSGIGPNGIEQAQLIACQLEATTAAPNRNSVQALLENNS